MAQGRVLARVLAQDVARKRGPSLLFQRPARRQPHARQKRGGGAVGYQGRKKARTTTALFLSDNRGQSLACASPQAGNHHDTHLLNNLFGEICASLEAANIPVAGLFLNADKAFDTKDFCRECARRDIEANIPRNRCAAAWQTADDTPFNPELYRHRVVVEHANAWLDGFKILLVRYETSVGNLLAWHWLAFVVIIFAKNQPKTDFLNSFVAPVRPP
ncbi:transposase [Hymenobacter siberiensis]|uniref:transposase n=1 Tax=Hymenobacter siberiensis TaxID=2848396 RepID=UPI00293D25EB|nr:transposase [Hymenobacter siberiensis]